MTRARTAVVAAALIAGSSSLAASQAPASITLPASTTCGTDVQGQVALNGTVDADFLNVEVASSIPATFASTSIKIARGARAGSFDVKCLQATQPVTVTFTARANGGTATGSINILANVLQSISVQPHTGEPSVQGTATLLGRAPPGGVVVALSSSSNNATVPQSVTVPANVSSAAFTIATRSVAQPTTVQILGTGFGVSRTADLVINPPTPVSVTTADKSGTFINNRNITGGVGELSIKVTLTMRPSAGHTAQLTSTNPALIAVPATVTFDGSSPDAIVKAPVATVAQATIVNITASGGGTNKIGTIQVLPPTLDDISVTPSPATGGQNVTLRVRLNGDAPSGGYTVDLTNTNPAAATIPATFTVPAGSRDATVPIQALRVENSATATLRASAAGFSRSTTLRVEPEGPTAVVLAPGTLIGGTAFVTARVDRVPSPDPLIVELASNNAAASVPASVTIPANATSASVSIPTTAVTENTTVSITARKGAITKGATLTLRPPAVTELTLSPSTVAGGQQSTAQITIGSPAPANFVVRLTTRESGQPTFGHDVPIPAGTTTGTFRVGTINRNQGYTVTVVATNPSGNKTAFLTVNPP